MIEERSLKLLRALHFFLKSFYLFMGRIARYAQSKELEIFLRKFRKSPTKQFLEIAYNSKLQFMFLNILDLMYLFLKVSWSKPESLNSL